ncbi:uncharacterized protein B0I36DRAFT_351567 [Microdochium trichocladiopsis]|uniref:Secreted protein n=1 Tax=Microdochium trichocladiopsis TaxID=1682393 RepID=A0A9P9BLJ3_9PEZI|nr:uncharacterized protein B0I36DRAFT_351567 [Microdochium trichocladiopsis]KAH7028147.1 hypothetical protein B0I36DRAFT_351567 [Microdochium trichocladiopsis]
MLGKPLMKLTLLVKLLMLCAVPDGGVARIAEPTVAAAAEGIACPITLGTFRQAALWRISEDDHAASGATLVICAAGCCRFVVAVVVVDVLTITLVVVVVVVVRPPVTVVGNVMVVVAFAVEGFWMQLQNWLTKFGACDRRSHKLVIVVVVVVVDIVDKSVSVYVEVNGSEDGEHTSQASSSDFYDRGVGRHTPNYCKRKQEFVDRFALHLSGVVVKGRGAGDGLPNTIVSE